MTLRADHSLIERFVSSLFRYADPGSFVSLRGFDQKERGRPAMMVHGVRIGNDLRGVVREATRIAGQMANAAEPAVFAPPVATFTNAFRARTEDLQNGVAISVDVDTGDTGAKRRTLESVLGPATIVMHSGGEWMDDRTGEVHHKLHLHWRLSEPTTTPDEHAQLQSARWLAAVLVDVDRTAAPSAHPLRWPGSWNLKGAPRLAEIAAENPDAEVHLADALVSLQEAVEAAGFGRDTPASERISGKPQAPVEVVASAMAAVPNVDAPWEEWNRIGMAVWAATGGAAGGLAAWEEWSAKSGKHVPQSCAERWQHYAVSPPTRIGAGTLFMLAQKEGWQRPRSETTRDEAAPPDDMNDPGYWASMEADHAMSEEQWQETEARESGRAARPSEEAVRAAGANLLRILDTGWEEASIPLRPWIARGKLMRRAVTVVSGQGSAGKSSLMVAWGACMALGQSFDRLRIQGPVRVGVYNVEDDEDEQRRRFSAFAQALKRPVHDFMGTLAILGPTTIGTLVKMTPDGRMLASTPVMEALEAWIIEARPDVLMLDPFVELHGQEENDNTAIRAVMAFLRNLAVRYDMAVVVLHHSRKGEAAPGDPDSLRGASAIVGAARVVLTLNVMTEAEAEGFGIAADRRRGYFRLDGAKSNYAAVDQAEWFERQERRIGNGPTEHDGDGVVIAWPWKPPSVWREMTPALIDAVIDRLSAGPAPGVLYTATKRGASNARWAGAVLMELMGHSEAQAKQVIGTWMKNGVLTETTYRDTSEGKDRTGVLVHRERLS